MEDEALKSSPLEIKTSALGGHGHDNRGFEAGAMPGAGYGRFGRMFNILGRPIKDDVLWDIAEAMVKVDVSPPITEKEEVDENPTIPAGYTYFGQFVDHDITFDPSPISVDRMDVAALEDFRTPALDLDSLYGRGPDDQPYMYHADSLRFREGMDLDAAGALPVRDLPRIPAAQGDNPIFERAVIGDKRNDENRIVAQFHSVMIRLHNKVIADRAIIEQFGGDFDNNISRFRAAVNCVRWHYQWIVVHDFLARRILKPGTIDNMFDADGAPRLRFYDKAEARFAYIPVEFAGAAYRIGHSMVRPGYSLNQTITSGTPVENPQGQEQDARIPIFTDGNSPTENLNGFGIVTPVSWGIDWAFFFDMGRANGTPGDFKLPQPSYRLDAQVVLPLKKLPEFRGEPDVRLRALAYRNLRRGTNVLSLPSGEQVAKALGVTHVLTPKELWQGFGSGKPFPKLSQGDQDDITQKLNQRSGVWAKWQQQLTGNTPLWYYILREAELLGVERKPNDSHIAFGGQHLGPVGSAIVAETFLGLLWRDDKSYLRRWPRFQPTLPKRPGSSGPYELADLVHFALS